MSPAAIAGEQAADQQAIGYRIGLAFAGIHNTLGGLGIDPTDSVKFADTRISASFDGAIGYNFAPNWGIQGDLQGTAIGRADKPDTDWTRTYGHGAIHLYYRNDSFFLGGFGGFGLQDDVAKSNKPRAYRFVGAEAKLLTGWGSVFGQAGYVDSETRWGEGLNDAPFARLGFAYFVADNWSIKADGAYAGGTKYNEGAPSRTLDFNLESEYRADAWPVSLFGRYEFTQISWHVTDSDAYSYGDNFHTFMVGLKFRSGTTLREADRAPGSLDLPSFGKWAAFSANEID
ncbi:hypothetical protein ACHMW7_03750 [Aminobacter sp. UC22_36]|uniref:hypothetical protein n=1 Tax=Aminobacter sp. UC22_36 TaxID=3374549 RepID=UPI0037577F91